MLSKEDLDCELSILDISNKTDILSSLFFTSKSVLSLGGMSRLISLLKDEFSSEPRLSITEIKLSD